MQAGAIRAIDHEASVAIVCLGLTPRRDVHAATAAAILATG
jgi:hypothetical protein